MKLTDLRFYFAMLSNRQYDTLKDVAFELETIMTLNPKYFPAGYQPDAMMKIVDELGFLKLSEHDRWYVAV